MFKAYAYLPGENAVEIAKNDVAGRLNDGKSLIWVDISSPIEDHLDFLKDVMRLHPLAVEDVYHPRMLPKVEEYDGQLFIVLHDIVLQDKDDVEQLLTYELFIFLGKNFLVTARKHRIRAVDVYHDDIQVLTHLFSRGIESVTHAILRRMIDNYFPMLDRVEAKLDASEDMIFSSSSVDLQQIFVLRKNIMKLRSIATQQLDVINRLAIGEFEFISPHGILLARDLYDHLFRVSEKAASFRETTMGLLDAHLTQVSNRMNEIMKVLTIIATIVLPLSIVVGFYGMNFRIIPGLNHPLGWFYTLLGMTGVIIGMLAYFRHKKWL